MDLTATLRTDSSAEDLFVCVDDLGRYPEWLDIVPSAVSAPSRPDDPGPAWFVTLRGRLGPLARSKRLRMVRVDHEPPVRARFERREDDGRDHSPWVLTATITADSSGALLSMQLHYGGGLWVPLLDRLLTAEIEQSRPRLAALARGDR